MLWHIFVHVVVRHLNMKAIIVYVAVINAYVAVVIMIVAVIIMIVVVIIMIVMVCQQVRKGLSS